MITNGYMRIMARYNRWQNAEIVGAAGSLSEGDRTRGRDAFWGSIHGTLSHLCWADQIWLARFGRIEPPGVPLKQSAGFIAAWPEIVERRAALDAVIIDWADGFAAGPVAGTLSWFSGAAGREVSMPVALVVTHIFNHQTHHRGQANALVAAAGGVNADTDLFLMPPEMWPA